MRCCMCSAMYLVSAICWELRFFSIYFVCPVECCFASLAAFTLASSSVRPSAFTHVKSGGALVVVEMVGEVLVVVGGPVSVVSLMERVLFLLRFARYI